MRRLAPVVAIVVSLSGCSAREIGLWLDWHAVDPAAAEAFANTPEIQARLAAGDGPSFDGDGFTPNLRNGHAERWEQIAWCETGRRWNLRTTNRTGTYGGGLAIRDDVWRAYGGREFASTGDQATKAQQIEVAERILDDVGWQAWQCA